MARALYLAGEAGIDATGLTSDLHSYGFAARPGPISLPSYLLIPNSARRSAETAEGSSSSWFQVRRVTV
jgi:hypothetical protein